MSVVIETVAATFVLLLGDTVGDGITATVLEALLLDDTVEVTIGELIVLEESLTTSDDDAMATTDELLTVFKDTFFTIDADDTLLFLTDDNDTLPCVTFVLLSSPTVEEGCILILSNFVEELNTDGKVVFIVIDDELISCEIVELIT